MINLLSFTAAMAIGYLGAFFLYWRELKINAAEQEKGIDIFLMISLLALAGARIGFVALNPAIFAADFGRVLLLSRYGGLSLYGAVLGVLAALVLSRNFFKYGDYLAGGAAFFTFAVYLAAGNYYFAGVFFFIWLMVNGLKKRISTSFKMASFFEKPGTLMLIYIMGLSALNFPLVKSRTDWLYYLWVLLLAASFGSLVAKNKKLMNAVVKFPAQVLAQIRTYLEERKNKTEKRIAELKKEDPFDDTDRLIDNAADDTEAHEKAGHERTLALTAQLNNILVQTRRALTKVKIGNYGTCENCGKMIDTDRLVAVPDATLCLSCEKKKEK